ncbi:macrophage mannose receptor 1-like [Megalobrama amblycephala]|uniref:macrophage mannose receptor 1-like n=1 Tax=Megalobrama amblycephala TaxID=75352 RepID=UPI00201452A0|nr:macrophage mannose receptor 1-like [Megalobrama amblycephala]
MILISVCPKQTQTHNRTDITTSTVKMPRHVNNPFSSLLLTAVVSLSAGALRQYHVVNQNLRWTEAQRYCREKYTDLVTINNMQDQNDIEQVIKRGKPGENRGWIGLRSTDTWIWSLDDSTFYTANESQYRNWEPGQPQGDGDCAFMKTQGKWHDITCSTSMRFICYNASKGFVPVQDLKNWTEAQRYCRDKHTDLASVRNESENNQIMQLTSPNDTWIGLHRLWVWSDNSTSTFTHWKPGEPDIKENRHDICTSIDTQHKDGWIDDPCTNLYHFMCYDDKLVLIRQNLTWTGALNYCRNNDMDLVSVFSEDVQRRVENVTASASSPHVWLGLRHSCVVGLWFWVNGQTLCYEQWAAGYGTGEEDCSTTVRSGAIRTGDQRWVSLPETDTNNFICIK